MTRDQKITLQVVAVLAVLLLVMFMIALLENSKDRREQINVCIATGATPLECRESM